MSCGTTNIFSVAAGRVAVIEEPSVQIAFAVDGDSQLFNNLKAVVSEVGIAAQGGFQFLHSMREFIYVYVFTERIGEIQLRGFAMTETCEALTDRDGAQGALDVEGNPDDCGRGTSGVERLLHWYDCNRITTRGEALVVSFGNDVSYNAFLVDMKVDITAADPVAKFMMTLKNVPHTVDGSDSCFDADAFNLTDLYGAQGSLDDPCVELVEEPRLEEGRYWW